MVFNNDRNSCLNENRCYWHKDGGNASVRKILSIRDRRVNYERLWGTALKKLGKFGSCSKSSFANWIHGEVQELDNFEILDGAKLFPSYLCLNTKGEEIFRCSSKRANQYIARNFAKVVSPYVLQFNNDQTEDTLKEIYGDLKEFPFFMHVKNDKCVCCGKTHNLTRHHIVPKRHKKKLPPAISKCMSNVLFVCFECHMAYEQHSITEPNSGITDPIQICIAWKDHFIKVMQPKFMPIGWDIFSIDPIKNGERICIVTI